MGKNLTRGGRSGWNGEALTEVELERAAGLIARLEDASRAGEEERERLAWIIAASIRLGRREALDEVRDALEGVKERQE
jgi:hypothetical protein